MQIPIWQLNRNDNKLFIPNAFASHLFRLNSNKMNLNQKIYFLLFYCILLINQISYSQVNLVVNPSFEDTVNCPIGPDELYKAVGWNSGKNSPDFMNSCNSFSVSVPNNWGGYQAAASGNSYAAFATYSNSSLNYREFLIGLLSSPMTIGTKYFVSFKVNLSIYGSLDANCASNKIGTTFSTVPYDVFNPAPITNNPPLYSDSIITDTLSWSRIVGSFIADSAYDYLLIGNFFDDANTDTQKIAVVGFSDIAYYFLDDVCVTTDSAYASQYDYTGINHDNLKPTFKLYPNPFSDYLFLNNETTENFYYIKIYNMLGQEVYSNSVINEKVKQIDLTNFCSGLFNINIKSKSYSFNYKLLKQ